MSVIVLVCVKDMKKTTAVRDLLGLKH